MRLFHRFFLILLGFSMIPVVGLGFWMLSARRDIRDNARSLHGRLATLVADTTERTLEQLNRTLGVVVDIERAGGSEKIEVPALRRAAIADPDVSYIAVLDSAGTETQRMADPELFPDVSPKDRSAEPALAKSRAENRLVLGEPRAEGGRALVPVVHPLSEGRALFMLYSLAGLQRRLARMGEGGRGRILLVDGQGRPVPGVGGQAPTADWVLPPAAGEEDGAAWQETPAPDGAWVAASRPIGALGWRAVSLQPRREAYAETDAAALRAAAFFAVLCLLVGIGAYALSLRLVQPLNVLISGAQRVSQSDFSQALPPLGWGELDDLGRSFNAMMEQLRRYQALQVDRVMEEKAKVDALVRNIPEGVVLAGFDGAIAFANGMATRVLGISSRTPKLSDLTRAPLIKDLAAAVAAGRKSESKEMDLRSVDGESLSSYHCQVLPVLREGRAIGIMVLMRDISVEKQLERVKDEFFHAIVHDLRGPITVIDGLVHYLRSKEGLDERAKRYVQLSAQATTRLTTLIKNILDIAKLESGTMKLAPSRFKAEFLLAPARDLLKVAADSKGVSLELEVAPDAGELLGDGELLERVIMNLAGNALKFTPQGGRVTFGALGGRDEVEFYIRDTGPGIPADKVADIFEKFKQLDRDVAARSGYGLGLSICRKIVELHEGRIWVESKEGQGSRFAFRLPRSGRAAQAALAAMSAA